MRHRSRAVHQTMLALTKSGLTTLGWVTPPVNFGADSVTFLDVQPTERGMEIEQNTLAVTLGESPGDKDEELGSLRSAWYPVFLDAYMAQDAYSKAILDDCRDIFQNQIFPVTDFTTGLPATGWSIEVEEVTGPTRPSAFVGAQIFKANWHIMKLGCRVYYQGP